MHPSAARRTSRRRTGGAGGEVEGPAPTPPRGRRADRPSSTFGRPAPTAARPGPAARAVRRRTRAQDVVPREQVGQRRRQRGRMSSGPGRRPRPARCRRCCRVPTAGAATAATGSMRAARTRVFRDQRRLEVPPPVRVQQRGEPVDGPRLEERVDRDLRLQLRVEPQLTALDGAQRVAAEREEVLVRAERRPVSASATDLGDPPRQRRRRPRPARALASGVPAATAGSGGRAATARSSLPFGVRGKLRQHHELGRDHVRRRGAGQSTAAAARPAGRPGRSGGCSRPTGWPSVSPNARTAASATAGWPVSRCSISPGSIRKPRILIWSSARPRISIRPSGCPRARSPVRYRRAPARAGRRSRTSPVRTATGRSGDEPLRGQRRVAEVADRHPGAADVQLAVGTRGRRCQRARRAGAARSSRPG